MFNLEKWPLGALDPLTDNSEYSCQSTSTCAQAEEDTSCQGVTSSTILRLEFPPRSPSTYLLSTIYISTIYVFTIYISTLLQERGCLAPRAGGEGARPRRGALLS